MTNLKKIIDKAVKWVQISFLHDFLKWHKPERSNITFDGCSLQGKCKICGKEILMDSQGNWFTFK
jgi:hypothetical protein